MGALLTNTFNLQPLTIEIEKFVDPSSKNANEVTLTFRNKEIRDAVKAAVRNLAGEGRRAGIPIQVPGNLFFVVADMVKPMSNGGPPEFSLSGTTSSAPRPGSP